jgi:hypothetical protein
MDILRCWSVRSKPLQFYSLCSKEWTLNTAYYSGMYVGGLKFSNRNFPNVTHGHFQLYCQMGSYRKWWCNRPWARLVMYRLEQQRDSKHSLTSSFVALRAELHFFMMSFIICTVHLILPRWLNQGGWDGKTCITHERDKKLTDFLSENLKEIGHLGDLSVDWSTVSKLILRK